MKPITRRPKAVEDVESHAMYIAEGSIDAALRFLERAEQTIKGLALFPESGGPFPASVPDLAGMRTRLVKGFPNHVVFYIESCLLYTSPSPRDATLSRMPSSA